MTTHCTLPGFPFNAPASHRPPCPQGFSGLLASHLPSQPPHTPLPGVFLTPSLGLPCWPNACSHGLPLPQLGPGSGPSARSVQPSQLPGAWSSPSSLLDEPVSSSALSPFPLTMLAFAPSTLRAIPPSNGSRGRRSPIPAPTPSTVPAPLHGTITTPRGCSPQPNFG